MRLNLNPWSILTTLLRRLYLYATLDHDTISLINSLRQDNPSEKALYPLLDHLESRKKLQMIFIQDGEEMVLEKILYGKSTYIPHEGQYESPSIYHLIERYQFSHWRIGLML